MMKFPKFCVVMTLLAVGVAWGAPRVVVDRADFVTGDNTNGWQMATASWQSPVYVSPVASVSLIGTNLANGASFTVVNQGNSFTVTSVGGAKLTSFSANYIVSKLLPPADLQVTNLVDAGFTASWSPVLDAVGYRLNFYTNVLEGVVAGQVEFKENFSFVPAKGSSTQLDPDTFNALTDTKAGWFFSTCYYGINPVSNVVQIGSSGTKGWLALPCPANGPGLTLVFAARRFESSGVNMPVSIVGGNATTNWLGSVALDVTDAVYYLPLPALSRTDTIYFHSTTNKTDGRVVLDSVKLLAGYDPGHVVTVGAGSAVVRGTSFATNSLPAVDYELSVTALAEEAKDDSDESPRIGLPLADPPLMPVLRAYPISQCVGGVYAEDFSALSAVTKSRTPWYNGVSPVSYWMCYRDNGTLVDEIGVGSTSTTTSGLFKFRSDKNIYPGGYAYGEVLGWRGTSERSFHTGIAFVNDTSAPRVNFRLSFVPCQWNYRNEVRMTNTVEYLVTNRLVDTAADGAWVEIPDLRITPPYTKDYNDGGALDWWGAAPEVPLTAAIPGLELKPGDYLVVRFTDPKTKSSGGVGITHFKLTSERKPLTSCIIFR